jgi:hypothetical protein
MKTATNILLYMICNSKFKTVKNILKTASVVQWSEFLATDPEARIRFPALSGKNSSGSGTGSTQPRKYN